MDTCASIKRLMEIKDVTEEDAKLIRAVWKNENIHEIIALYPSAQTLWIQNTKMCLHTLKRLCVDKILQTYGVEFLGMLKRTTEDVYHCNTGDTYAATAVFIGSRLVVNCWGHYAEKNLLQDLSKLKGY